MHQKEVTAQAACLCLLGAALMWGLQAVGIKVLLAQYTTLTVIVVRCLAMIVCYFLVIRFTEGLIPIPNKAQFLRLAAMGFAGIIGNNFIQFEGLRYTTAFNGTLLCAMVPSLTAVLAYFILKEKLTFFQWAGIALSFTGVVLLLVKGDIQFLWNLQFNRGDLLIMVSEVSWAAYIIISRPLLKEMSSLAVAAWSVLLGIVMLLPYSIVTGEVQLAMPHVESVVAFLYVVLAGGVFAMYLWNVGVRRMGAGKSSVFSNVTAVAGLIFGNLFLQEGIHLYGVLSILIVGTGVYMLIHRTQEA